MASFEVTTEEKPPWFRRGSGSFLSSIPRAADIGPLALTRKLNAIGAGRQTGIPDFIPAGNSFRQGSFREPHLP
jgi:hypothetical protein